MEGKRYDLILGGLTSETVVITNSEKYPQGLNISRGRSSVEVSVMEMERRTEQIYQLLNWKLISSYESS